MTLLVGFAIKSVVSLFVKASVIPYPEIVVGFDVIDANVCAWLPSATVLAVVPYVLTLPSAIKNCSDVPLVVLKPDAFTLPFTSNFAVAEASGEPNNAIVLHDVDVTSGNANGTVLYLGVVNKARCNSIVQGWLTAGSHIGDVFIVNMP